MSNYLQKIVYLTEEQAQTLFNTGSVTSNGITVNYNDNDLYVTEDDGRAEGLKHSLTFGNGTYVFDGTADVTVPVYTGGY